MTVKVKAALLAALIACSAVSPQTFVNAEQPIDTTQDVKFHFLNVNDIPGQPMIGSADCIIIEDNGVVTMLDTGWTAEYSIEKIVNYLNDLGITKIDHLLATHPHNDHIGGMPAIINTFDVGTLYARPSDWGVLYQHEQSKKGTRYMYDEMYLAATRKLNSDGSTITIVEPKQDGMTIQINEFSSFELWNCEDPWNDCNYRPEFNDYSIVMKYTHKDVSALLLADINSYYESSFAGKIGECEIFKVAHHGTWGTISTDNLFQEIQSQYAVITGVRGNFGTITRGEHYLKTTQNTLQELNIPYTINAAGTKITVSDKYAALLGLYGLAYDVNMVKDSEGNSVADGTLNIQILGGDVEDVLSYYGMEYTITQDGDVIITTDGTNVWMKQNLDT